MSFYWRVECCGGGLCDGEDEVGDEIDVGDGDRAFFSLIVCYLSGICFLFFISRGRECMEYLFMRHERLVAGGGWVFLLVSAYSGVGGVCVLV